MTMESNNFPGPRDDIDSLNRRAMEVADRATSILCAQTIAFVHAGIETHLLADREHIAQLREANYPSGELRGLFVLQDKLNAPRNHDHFINTFTTRLEPSGENPEGQYILLHIPAHGEKIGSFTMPSMDEVEEVYLEVGDTTDVHWYAVGRNGLYEYIPLAQQEEEKSVLTDQGIWQWVSDRIPEGMETITGLFRQIVNWDTVPQRLAEIRPLETDDDGVDSL